MLKTRVGSELSTKLMSLTLFEENAVILPLSAISEAFHISHKILRSGLSADLPKTFENRDTTTNPIESSAHSKK